MGQERHDYLAREFDAEALDKVLDAEREHRRLILLDAHREHHRLHGRYRAVAHAHEVGEGLLAVAYEGEDVGIDNLGTHDYRAAVVLLQRLEVHLEALCHLEAHIGCRGVHLLLEVCAHGAQVALQNRCGEAYVAVVLLGRYGVDAGGFAVAYVVLQAGGVAPLLYLLAREVQAAGA